MYFDHGVLVFKLPNWKVTPEIGHVFFESKEKGWRKL